MTTPLAPDLEAEIRAGLAADPALGCGNFLRAAAARPDGDVARVTIDAALDLPGLTGRTAFSARELLALADGYAASYAARGIGRRDPVAIYADDSLIHMLHVAALDSLGAIAVLVNGRMAPATAAEFVRRTGAVLLVLDDVHRDALAGEARLPTTIRLAGIKVGDPAMLPVGFPYRHHDDDPVLVCHSSGTTGVPKAVTFAHQQFFYGVRRRLGEPPAPWRSRLLSALPHSHSAGLAFPMLALLSGEPIHLCDALPAERVARAAAAVKPTMVVAFPQTFVGLTEIEVGDALHGVRAFVNTGDAAHHGHIQALLARAPGAVFVDGLGSSEMGFSLFRRVHRLGDPDRGRLVGAPLPFVEAVVLGEEGARLPDGAVGRLGVRSPTVTPGYWNDSLTTARARVDGFFLTGDLVVRNPDGEFVHVDRASDAIVTPAGLVPTLPLEEAIAAEVAEIADCTVVGVPGPGGAPVAIGVVRLVPGAAPDVAALLGRCRAALARRGLHELAGLVIAAEDDLPVGPTGKVLKRVVRERLAARGVEASS